MYPMTGMRPFIRNFDAVEGFEECMGSQHEEGMDHLLL
jgi:hypothetical protein